MNPLVDALLSSWPTNPGLVLALAATAIVYLRGWRILQRRDPQRWHSGQPTAFLAGLLAIFLALASPLEPFSFLLLQVHMLQHLLLMMAVPPLLWLGEPLFPLLRGLPAPIRTYWIAPLFRSPTLRRFCETLTHPVTAWLLYVGTTWLWHLPASYELAVRSDGWHYVQHLAFLVTGLLFWYPVVRPYPSRPTWSRWLLFPYLLLADVQNTVLAALLTFANYPLYPHYAQMPRLNGLTVLDDQATAGVLMWVPGSLVFLGPLVWIATRMLFGVDTIQRTSPVVVKQAVAGLSSVVHLWGRPPGLLSTGRPGGLPHRTETGSRRIALPMLSPARPQAETADLLRLPALGRFLRWRHARLCLQLPLLVLAAAVIYDGLTGPAVAPLNLAGVLPWIHWRGLVVLGLLAVGNVFCLACPFMVPRLLARRFLPARFAWPRRLRNKWLAVLLIAVFLWAYEAFALWDSPWWTAWVALGYFTAALLVDSLFKDAAFCKYLCPIGQFNFVQSLLSPWEVKVRRPEVCASCATKDCIRGRPSPQPARGCEMHLFLPRKASNLDCTLCLDCIHACPHDNIGLLSVPPAGELWRDRLRSGVGRLARRPDLAALVIVLVFGAFANAGGMVAPVAEGLSQLQERWGNLTPFWAVSTFYFLALLVAPALAIGSAAWLGPRWAGLSCHKLELAAQQVYCLVPLGFAIWLCHYGFHLTTSYDAALPAGQRFLGDLLGNSSTADLVCGCCRPVADWLPRLEIVIMDIGLLLSLYAGYRIARTATHDRPQAVKVLVPWALILVLLWTAGVWIVLQPMQMRGTLSMAG